MITKYNLSYILSRASSFVSYNFIFIGSESNLPPTAFEMQTFQINPQKQQQKLKNIYRQLFPQDVQKSIFITANTMKSAIGTLLLNISSMLVDARESANRLQEAYKCLFVIFEWSS